MSVSSTLMCSSLTDPPAPVAPGLFDGLQYAGCPGTRWIVSQVTPFAVAAAPTGKMIDMAYLPSLPDDAVLLDVFRAYPQAAPPLLDYHQALLRGPSPLTEAEREPIAAYVSALNACRCCWTATCTSRPATCGTSTWSRPGPGRCARGRAWHSTTPSAPAGR